MWSLLEKLSWTCLYIVHNYKFDSENFTIVRANETQKSKEEEVVLFTNNNILFTVKVECTN